jgi:hypothetical protein
MEIHVSAFSVHNIAFNSDVSGSRLLRFADRTAKNRRRSRDSGRLKKLASIHVLHARISFIDEFDFES